MFVFVSFAIFSSGKLCKGTTFFISDKIFHNFFSKNYFCHAFKRRPSASQTPPLRLFFKSECKGRNFPVNNKIFPLSTVLQQQHDTTHLTTYHNITLIFFAIFFSTTYNIVQQHLRLLLFLVFSQKISHPFIQI